VRKYFSEYFRPTEEEKKAVWRDAVFVFDANVLLNSYRLSRETSLAILEILKVLSGRLFLPHQVGVEFYRHREDEIAQQVNAFERVRRHLNSIPQSFKTEFSRHPCIPIASITEALKQTVEKQISIVTESQKAHQLNFFAHDDPMLPQLDQLFSDATEGPYDIEEEETLNRQVEERVQSNIPPCVVSASGKASVTPENNPHRGDGRVWFQIVRYAKQQRKPIVFVTADYKSNWWRTTKLGNEERSIGPHFMLIRDIESAAGKTFLMYTQEDFLSFAPQYLGVPEQQQAIEEVKQIQEHEAKEKEDYVLDAPAGAASKEPEDQKEPSDSDAELSETRIGTDDDLDEPKTSSQSELNKD
jgi:hypothetical protein